jgi:hypothetical protein
MRWTNVYRMWMCSNGEAVNPQCLSSWQCQRLTRQLWRRVDGSARATEEVCDVHPGPPHTCLYQPHGAYRSPRWKDPKDQGLDLTINCKIALATFLHWRGINFVRLCSLAELVRVSHWPRESRVVMPLPRTRLTGGPKDHCWARSSAGAWTTGRWPSKLGNLFKTLRI